MSGKRRRKKRKKKSRQKVRRRDQTTAEEAPLTWKGAALVIGLALVLFAIFVMTQFDPIDRKAMAGFSLICVGLGLVIPGVCQAVGNFDFQENSRLEKRLNHLATLATPQRRWGEMFYSRKAWYVVFEKILIAIILPMGLIMVFIRPRQTWPAIVWVGGGFLAMFAGWVVYFWDASQTGY